MKTIFAKVNDQYARCYQTRTKIMEEPGGTRCVVKLPVYEEAVGHISNMLRCSHELRECYPSLELCPAEPFKNGIRFPYVRGKNAGEILLERAQTGGEETVLSALDAIWDILPTASNNCCQFSTGEDFELWFGKAPELEGLSAVRRCAFDFTPSNLLFPEEGKPVFIDYEWYLQFPVPVDLLKFHFLKCLYMGVPSIDCWLPWDKAYVCFEGKSVDALERCYTFFLNQLYQEPGGEPAMHRIKPRYLKRSISIHDMSGIQVEQAQKWMVFLEERLADRERGLQEKDAWIDEQAGQIRYLQEIAAEKKKTLVEKDIWIDGLQQKIQEMQQAIVWHEDSLQEKEAKFAAVRQQLSANVQQLAEAGEEIARLKAVCAEDTAQMEMQRGQIHTLETKLDRIESTLVWRLTMPFHKDI